MLGRAQHVVCHGAGAADDVLVDAEAAEELARYYNTNAIVVPRLAHDCMLVRGPIRQHGATGVLPSTLK